jgi:hypothetical protein
MEIVVSRVHSQALSYAAMQDLNILLAPPAATGFLHTPGLSPFEQMLLRSMRAPVSRDGADAPDHGECIQFLRFWQAMQEVWRRMHCQAGSSDDAPLVEELAPFRDAVLRRLDASSNVEADPVESGLTVDWLVEEISTATSMSTDPDAWKPLASAVPHASEGCITLEEICEMIYAWLVELVSDYCHGPRNALARAVMDVAECTFPEACWHLGASRWDVEVAIIAIFASRGDSMSASRGAWRSWSSGGAKLRRNEVECPICVTKYDAEHKSVSTHCCFQTLCGRCRSKLAGVEGFQCPFCRGFEKHSREERRRYVWKRKSSQLLGHVDSMFQAARGVAGSAGQLFGELASAALPVAVVSEASDSADAHEPPAPPLQEANLPTEAPLFHGSG